MMKINKKELLLTMELALATTTLIGILATGTIKVVNWTKPKVKKMWTKEPSRIVTE